MNNDAKRVVDIVITRETSGLSSADFSTPLLIASTTSTSTSVYTVSSAKGVLEIDVGGTPLFTETSPEYYSAQAHFNQTNCPAKLKIAVCKTGTVTEKLNSIIAIDNQWYGLIFLSNTVTTADFITAGAWVKENSKFMFCATNDTEVLESDDSTSLAFELNDNSITKAMILYDPNFRDVTMGLAGYIDVAFASMILGKTIGSYTSSFKILSGMKVTSFTGTQIEAMKSNNVVWYNEMYGKNITCEWTRTTGGVESEWIDVEIGIDWLGTRMQEAVLQLIFGVEKVPYTQAGIAMLKSPVDRILTLGVMQKLLNDYKIFTESVNDQSFTDRSTRTYNGLSWEADLAGAIHKTKINGKVRV